MLIFPNNSAKKKVYYKVSGKFCYNAAKTVKKNMQKIQINNIYSK